MILHSIRQQSLILQIRISTTLIILLIIFSSLSSPNVRADSTSSFNYKESGFSIASGSSSIVPQASTENGGWSAIGPVFDTSVSFAVSPEFTQDKTIFLVNRASFDFFQANVSKSIDGGTHWNVVMPNFSINGGTARIRISPNYSSDNTVFLEKVSNGTTNLLKSVDGGVNWKEVLTQSGNLGDLIISPNYTTDQMLILYGGFISHDKGETWTQIGSWPGNSSSCRIYISPGYSTDNAIFVLCSDFARFGGSKLYQSSNQGQTWSDPIIIPLYIESMSLSPNFTSDHIIFARSSENGFLRSTDSGLSWQEINNGAPTPPDKPDCGCSGDYISVSPNFSSDHTLIAFSRYGVERLYRSTDGGANWIALSLAGTLVQGSVAFSPHYGTDNTLFVFGSISAIKSTDSGVSWTSISPRMFPRGLTKIKLSPDYSHDQTVFAADSDDSIGNRTLFRSVDGGVTWIQSTPYSAIDVKSIAISPEYAKDKTLFVGATSTRYRGATLLKSVDNGLTWEESTNGITRGAHNILPDINSVIFSPNYANDNILLIGTSSGIFKSVDKGLTWSTTGLNGQLVNQIVSSPNFISDNIIFAGTTDGVYKSSDQGATWQLANQGLVVGTGPDAYTPSIISMSISPAFKDDNTVLVGTYGGGIYKTVDGGVSWVAINNGLPPQTAQAAIDAVLFSPSYASDKTIYTAYTAISDSSAAGVFQSGDQGTSWIDINNNIGNKSARDAAITPDSSVLFIGTDGGGWKLHITNISDNRASLAISVNAPGALSIVNNIYSPNPFNVTAIVTNTSTIVAKNVVIQLQNIASGLSIADGASPQIVIIGDITPGQAHRVSWKIQAAPQTNGATLTYSVGVLGTNVDTKIFNQSILLPGLVKRPFNVAIILVQTPKIQPSIIHNATYYRNFFSNVSKYHNDNSYGRVNLSLAQVYDNNGKYFSFTGKAPKKPSGDDLLKLGIDQVCDPNGCPDIDMFIILHSGSSTDAIDAGFVPPTNKSGINSYTNIASINGVKHPYIILGEDDPLGIWAHEIGHALGWLLSDGRLPLTPHPTRGGSNCTNKLVHSGMCLLDLMARGGSGGVSRLDGTRPTYMSSITRHFLGIVEYTDVAIPSTFPIDALETKTDQQGAKAVRLTFPNDPGQCYILEVRTNNAQYSYWDQSLMNTGLVVYKVKTNGNSEPCGNIVTDGSKNQISVQDISVEAILSPSAASLPKSYVDKTHKLKITATSEAYNANSYQINVSVEKTK